MTNYAYYNEHEPYAAEWLRNLIATGLIAPGYVDERDIQDVETYDLQGFFQHHFFAGIGIWSHALRKCGWPDDRPVVTGSCPCQPFSCAGSGRGLADDRHLWPDFFRLIRQMRPQLVLGEQVASPGGLAWFDVADPELSESFVPKAGPVPFQAAKTDEPDPTWNVALAQLLSPPTREQRRQPDDR